MIESNGEAQAQGPGAKLAAARERADLAISEVAQRLHLDVDSLRALEADQLAIFGAAVFARGHLRRYAELLGVPASDIDAAYAAYAQAPPSTPELRRGGTILAEVGTPAAPLRPGTAVIAAGVLVLAVLAWWAVRTPPRSKPVFGRTSVTVPPPSRAAVTVRQKPLGGSGTSAVGSEAAVPASAAASPAAATPAVAASGAVHLSLKFSQDCWTEIYDVRGGRLFYELATAGAQRHLSGLAPLRVVLGNPEGVTLELDGRAVSLPSGRHTPLRFALDSRGHMVDVQAGRGPAASAITPAPAAVVPPTPSPAPQP